MKSPCTMVSFGFLRGISFHCIEILKTELTISHRTEAQCRRTTGRSAQANPSAPGAHHVETWTRGGSSLIDKMKNMEMERQHMKNGWTVLKAK